MENLKIPDGMLFFEYVLLLLGIIFFLVLLLILIIYTVQKRPLKQLFLFFTMPMLMIGYPGIQKISYDNGVLSIEKFNNILAISPQDTTVKKELEETLEKVGKRPISNPQTLTKLGKGYATLGDTLKAIDLMDDALVSDSNFAEAIQMKKTYSTPGVNIDRLTQEVEKNPENTEAKAELQREINLLELSPALKDVSVERIVNSSALLGDTMKVMKYIDSLNINSLNDRKKISDLKTRFSGRKINR